MKPPSEFKIKFQIFLLLMAWLCYWPLWGGHVRLAATSHCDYMLQSGVEKYRYAWRESSDTIEMWGAMIARVSVIIENYRSLSVTPTYKISWTFIITGTAQLCRTQSWVYINAKDEGEQAKNSRGSGIWFWGNLQSR